MLDKIADGFKGGKYIDCQGFSTDIDFDKIVTYYKEGAGRRSMGR